MTELVINPSGTVTDYFVVSLDGSPYAVPERGADLVLRLKGRVPSRYGPGGITADFGQGADEEGILVVERFVPWAEEVSAGGILHFEGFVSRPDGALHAHGGLAFDTLAMPPGILAMLSYEGLSPENRHALSGLSSPPLGTLRMS